MRSLSSLESFRTLSPVTYVWYLHKECKCDGAPEDGVGIQLLEALTPLSRIFLSVQFVKVFDKQGNKLLFLCYLLSAPRKHRHGRLIIMIPRDQGNEYILPFFDLCVQAVGTKHFLINF